MPVPFLACMIAAASMYHLPPRILPAIQAVEGGAAGMVHPNANDTADFGLMQINSLWLEPLSQILRSSPDRVKQRLIEEPCFNILVAGAILRTYLDQEHGDLLLAVGDYHSHQPASNLHYRQKIVQAAKTLFEPGG